MKTVKIIQGSELSLSVSLKDSKSCGGPYDLAGFVGATAFFHAATGGAISSVASLVSSDRGIVSVPISSLLSAGLLLGDAQDFQLNVNQNGDTKIAIFSESIDVVAQIF